MTRFGGNPGGSHNVLGGTCGSAVRVWSGGSRSQGFKQREQESGFQAEGAGVRVLSGEGGEGKEQHV